VPGEHTIELGIAGQIVAKSVIWVGGGSTASLDGEQ